MYYVVDLFCGAGGFSEGARMAGAQILVAIDNCEKALSVHKHHHNTALHFTRELGGDLESVTKLIVQSISGDMAERLKVGDDILHIHASPPCQLLSSVNRHANAQKGIDLVLWSLRLFAELTKIFPLLKWTLEEVNNFRLRRVLDEAMVCYRVLHLGNFGVPQSRRRIIALSDETAFKRMVTSYTDWRKLIQIPPGSKYISNGSLYEKRIREKDFKHSRKRDINKSPFMYTLTSAKFRWYDENLETTGLLDIESIRKLQTFPDDYSGTKQMFVNAVPPVFACALIRALQIGTDEKK